MEKGAITEYWWVPGYSVKDSDVGGKNVRRREQQRI